MYLHVDGNGDASGITSIPVGRWCEVMEEMSLTRVALKELRRPGGSLGLGRGGGRSGRRNADIWAPSLCQLTAWTA